MKEMNKFLYCHKHYRFKVTSYITNNSITHIRAGYRSIIGVYWVKDNEFLRDYW